MKFQINSQQGERSFLDCPPRCLRHWFTTWIWAYINRKGLSKDCEQGGCEGAGQSWIMWPIEFHGGIASHPKTIFRNAKTNTEKTDKTWGVVGEREGGGLARQLGLCVYRYLKLNPPNEEKHEFIIKSKLKVNKTAPKDAQQQKGTTQWAMREGDRKTARYGTEDNLFGDPETHQSGQKHRNFSNCSCFADYNEPSEVLNRRQNCPRQSLSLPFSHSLFLSLFLCTKLSTLRRAITTTLRDFRLNEAQTIYINFQRFL